MHVSYYSCVHLLLKSPTPAFFLANHFIRWLLAPSLPKSLSTKENFLLQKFLSPLTYHHQIMTCSENLTNMPHLFENSTVRISSAPNILDQPFWSWITDPRGPWQSWDSAVREESQQLGAQKWTTPLSKSCWWTRCYGVFCDIGSVRTSVWKIRLSKLKQVCFRLPASGLSSPFGDGQSRSNQCPSVRGGLVQWTECALYSRWATLDSLLCPS